MNIEKIKEKYPYKETKANIINIQQKNVGLIVGLNIL